MRILFSSNSSWSVYNFRRNLLLVLKAKGHQVYIIAPQSEYLKKLEELGFKTIPVMIDNSSKNFLSNFKLIFSYLKLYKSVDPDIIMHNAIKPNIYGAIVCRFLKIPVINNISGIGSIFMKKGISTLIGNFLYWISQKKVQKVFFQNSSDLELFITKKLVKSKQCELIPGSGVNIQQFKPKPKDNKSDIVKFCFVGRLLGDKGIHEFIEASKMIHEKYTNTKFFILGELYQQNPTAITKIELNSWIEDNIVNYLGKSDHIENELYKFDCIVLPSYREGLSKVLLEASSMAIPAITTNVPGCKDVVTYGFNGFICKVRDSYDLFIQMEKFISLSPSERKIMGLNGRLKVENEFDENIVIQKYIKAIEQIKPKK